MTMPNEGPPKGEKFDFVKTKSTRRALSKDKVEAYFLLHGLMEDLPKLYSDSDVVTIKTPRLDGSKPAFVMPNFENATVTGLIDMLGECRERMKDDKKLEGLIKTRLGAELGFEVKESAPFGGED
jgi:hypothetical protein